MKCNAMSGDLYLYSHWNQSAKTPPSKNSGAASGELVSNAGRFRAGNASREAIFIFPSSGVLLGNDISDPPPIVKTDPPLK